MKKFLKMLLSLFIPTNGVDDETKNKTSYKIKHEIQRTLIIFLFLTAVLFRDSNISVVLFSLSVVIFSLFSFHIARKLLFPYLNLGKLVAIASETPLSAGITVAAFLYLASVVIQSIVVLLK